MYVFFFCFLRRLVLYVSVTLSLHDTHMPGMLFVIRVCTYALWYIYEVTVRYSVVIIGRFVNAQRHITVVQ